MKKKDRKKGLTDETIKGIRTVSTLFQRTNEELDKRKKEAEAQDRANEVLLIKTEGEERALIKEISEAKKVVAKMIADYGQIEANVETSERKKIEENVLRESDVRSGKVSLAEFNTKGKYDAKIAEETLTKSAAELESLLPVIRDKNLEILQLKEKLGAVQNTIRSLKIRPGIIMRDLFKQLYEFSDEQLALFLGELESLRYEWNQAKMDVLLTQGKSMSGRHVFSCETMVEARNVQFDPILPLKCVKQLKQELLKYEGSGGVRLTLYMNLGEIEVTSIVPRRSGAIQTAHMKEDKESAIFKRKDKF